MVGYVGKGNMELGFGFGGLGNKRFVGLWLQEVLLTRLGWVQYGLCFGFLGWILI